MNTLPENYLLVTEMCSGTRWIEPLSQRVSLDLATRVRAWVRKEFRGELVLDGALMPKVDGDYYAAIKLDHEPPDSIRCWAGGGFYLKPR